MGVYLRRPIYVEYVPRLSSGLIGRVMGYGHDALGPYMTIECLAADHPTYLYGQELKVSAGADIRTAKRLESDK
jgi:hypothetical protein